ncbi:HET-domain-containing protein [Xylaria scruposa]|nr:HET-domain-containing protein [Xylaria scruposa]
MAVASSIANGCQVRKILTGLKIVYSFIPRKEGSSISFPKDGGTNRVVSDGLTAQYVKTRLQNQYPLSHGNVRWMRHCLQQCRTKHTTCNELRQKVSSYRLPKYMVDLDLGYIGKISIVETNGKNMPYAILTYCWGQDSTILEAINTTSKNIQQRFTGFNLSTMPKTIRDAAEVAHALGLRYLWVDALCIQQDQDIQKELNVMSDFYARATVVISASSAAASNSGFLEPRHLLLRKYEVPFALIVGENTEHDRVGLVERISEKKPEPIDKRGWTHSEQNSGLCIFRFESERVLWECGELTFADSDIGMLSPDQTDFYGTSSFDGSKFASMLPQTKYDFPENHLMNWIKAVIEYSPRHTESLDDKLGAFAETAKNMASITGWDSSQYKAGLWMTDIPRQLLWCRDYRSEKSSVITSSATTTLTPSWSWASSSSPVIWDDHNALDWNYTLEVVQCEVKLASLQHPFQNVKEGRLVVRAYLHEVFWDGSEFVESPHHETDENPRWVAKPCGLNISCSPFKFHASDDQDHPSKSPFSPDRQTHYRLRFEAEHLAMGIELVWDTSTQPTPQRVRFLEVRSGFETDGHSYGVIISYNGSDVSKRLGYFNFQHRINGVSRKPRLDKADDNWLRQERRRTVCII